MSFAQAAKKIRFVQAYLRYFDLPKACEAADIPHEIGQRFLEDPTVKPIVEKELDFAFRRMGVTPARTILQIAEIAYKEPLLSGDVNYAEERAEILEFVSVKEQIKGLELLAKYQEALGVIADTDKKEEVGLIETKEDAIETMKRLKGRDGHGF